jgi:hypothetical protein
MMAGEEGGEMTMGAVECTPIRLCLAGGGEEEEERLDDADGGEEAEEGKSDGGEAVTPDVGEELYERGGIAEGNDGRGCCCCCCCCPCCCDGRCDDVDDAGDERKDVLSFTGRGGMFAHTGCIDCLDMSRTAVCECEYTTHTYE